MSCCSPHRIAPLAENPSPLERGAVDFPALEDSSSSFTAHATESLGFQNEELPRQGRPHQNCCRRSLCCVAQGVNLLVSGLLSVGGFILPFIAPELSATIRATSLCGAVLGTLSLIGQMCITIHSCRERRRLERKVQRLKDEKRTLRRLEQSHRDSAPLYLETILRQRNETLQENELMREERGRLLERIHELMQHEPLTEEKVLSHGTPLEQKEDSRYRASFHPTDSSCK